MNRTVTATFRTPEALHNALIGLLACGIPREQILAEVEEHMVKVIIPSVTEPEVLELLGGYNPRRITGPARQRVTGRRPPPPAYAC